MQHASRLIHLLAALVLASAAAAEDAADAPKAPIKILDGTPTVLYITGTVHYPAKDEAAIARYVARLGAPRNLPIEVRSLRDSKTDPKGAPRARATPEDWLAMFADELRAAKSGGKRFVVLAVMKCPPPVVKSARAAWPGSAVDELDRFARLTLAAGADAIFLTEGGIGPGRGEDANAQGVVFDTLAERNIPRVQRGPRLIEHLVAEPRSFKDGVHYSREGLALSGLLWVESLLRHDGAEIPAWMAEERAKLFPPIADGG